MVRYGGGDGGVTIQNPIPTLYGNPPPKPEQSKSQEDIATIHSTIHHHTQMINPTKPSQNGKRGVKPNYLPGESETSQNKMLGARPKVNQTKPSLTGMKGVK